MKRNGCRSDWSRDERNPRSVRNEGLTRVSDNVARIVGLRDPNNSVDADHTESFAISNIQHFVGFDFDLAVTVCLYIMAVSQE
jgi:hypothetical protein